MRGWRPPLPCCGCRAPLGGAEGPGSRVWAAEKREGRPWNVLSSFLWASGNYFASHFFMGGEKFDMPHPEGYLFGENMDLNFLGNRPVQVSAGSPGNFPP